LAFQGSFVNILPVNRKFFELNQAADRDLRYGIICSNNPVNFVDPLGLCGDYTGAPDQPLGETTLDLLAFLTPIKIPLIGAVLGKASEYLPSLAKRLIAKGETEIIQRAMSRGELKAIQESGVLSRGGRAGPHYASDAVNTDALRARQRLSLSQTPEVRATIEVPSGVFSSPSRVQPNFGMPGGGMERTAPGDMDIPAKVLDVLGY